MTSKVILSLFPGVGLLDRGFEEAWPGVCIVRGPDVLWGGNIKTFHAPPGIFNGIIGGPPCQPFSRLQCMVAHNRKKELALNPDSTRYALAENLIPDFVRVINEAQPTWFLMENTPEVPPDFWPQPEGYQVGSFILNNRWVPDTTPQNRERRFWFGHQGRLVNLVKHLEVSLFEPIEFEYAVTASGSGGGASVPIRQGAKGKPKRLPKNRGSSRTVAEYNRLQGLPETFLGDAPFTVEGKRRVIGNGVPLPLGRALARAIKAALNE